MFFVVPRSGFKGSEVQLIKVQASKGLIPLLIHYPFWGLNPQAIGNFFLWGALIFTIWSGADYFIKYRKLLKT